MHDVAVHYQIEPFDPAGHRFRVVLTVARPDPAGQTLRLPAWIPGSYMIREFARHLSAFAAQSGGAAVGLRKLDKDTWRADPCSGPLVVRYEVYAWDLSVRAAHLDDSHGFFNGTSTFLAVVGQEDEPHRVEIVLPPALAHWEVCTTLPRIGGSAWGPGTFEAADYDALIDHPVELGTPLRTRFFACGVPHDVVITGRVRVDLSRLVADLTAICEAQIRFFGEPAPMDRYLFLVMAVGDGYGGLEHRSSTALICKRDDLPAPGAEEISEGYLAFLGLCSHEYFHTWNVKRIKPKAFVPYDLRREAYTDLLWAFEGITSYYDDLFLLRAGLIDEAKWLELVGRTATMVERSQGRRHETLAEASFDAWTKYYRQDEDFANRHVSYYTQGSLAALATDLHLRARTGGRVGLDDVMKALWARRGDGSGVAESEVEATASELAGEDLSAFFGGLLRSTEASPLPDLLASVGVTWRTRAATSEKDKGGKAAKTVPSAHLGARLSGTKVLAVAEGGPAHAAGLSAGDVVVALDGLKADGDLDGRCRALPPGAEVRVHAFRRDELKVFVVTLGEPPATTVWLEADPERAGERAWLMG